MDIVQKAGTNETVLGNLVLFSGGRKEKISKGDIAGLFCVETRISTRTNLGEIELKNRTAPLWRVPFIHSASIGEKLNKYTLKKEKSTYYNFLLIY